MKTNPALEKLFEQGLIWNARSKNIGFSRSPKPILINSSKIHHQKLKNRYLQFADNLLSQPSIHELSLDDGLSNKAFYRWHPPLSFTAAVIGQFSNIITQKNAPRADYHLIAWIGKRCWPTPYLLRETFNWQPDYTKHSLFIFINPPDKNKRLWTIIQFLRCSAAFSVVADGSGFNLAETRRLHSAAIQGKTIGLLLRPPWEINKSSAADTKWLISPFPNQDIGPEFEAPQQQWSFKLIKAKGSFATLASLIQNQKEHSNEQLRKRYAVRF